MAGIITKLSNRTARQCREEIERRRKSSKMGRGESWIIRHDCSKGEYGRTRFLNEYQDFMLGILPQLSLSYILTGAVKRVLNNDEFYTGEPMVLTENRVSSLVYRFYCRKLRQDVTFNGNPKELMKLHQMIDDYCARRAG